MAMDALVFRPGSVGRLLRRVLGEAAPRPWGLLHPGLRVRPVPEVAPPTEAVEAAGDGWVRIRVLLASVSPADLDLLCGRGRRGRDLRRAVVPGAELVGEVIGTRGAAAGLVAGQRVVVNPILDDGRRLGADPELPGGWAPVVVAPRGRVHVVPEALPPRTALLALALARVLPAVAWLLDAEAPGPWWLDGDPAEVLAACALLSLAGAGHPVGVTAPDPVPALAARMGLEVLPELTSGAAGALLQSSAWTSPETRGVPWARVAPLDEEPAAAPAATRVWRGYADLSRALALTARAPSALAEALTHAYPLRQYRRALDQAEADEAPDAGRAAFDPGAS